MRLLASQRILFHLITPPPPQNSTPLLHTGSFPHLASASSSSPSLPVSPSLLSPTLNPTHDHPPNAAWGVTVGVSLDPYRTSEWPSLASASLPPPPPTPLRGVGKGHQRVHYYSPLQLKTTHHRQGHQSVYPANRPQRMRGPLRCHRVRHIEGLG